MHLSGRDLLGVLFICISYSDGLVLKSKFLSVSIHEIFTVPHKSKSQEIEDHNGRQRTAGSRSHKYLNTEIK